MPFAHEVADFYPLSLDEIEEMLTKLAERRWSEYAGGESQMIADICVRLVQAIPGMTSPRPIYGETAERMVAVEELFVYAIAGGLHISDRRSLAISLFATINY